MCNALDRDSKVCAAVSKQINNNRYAVGLRIILLVGIAWAIDAGSKHWVKEHLVNHPVQLIPNFLYLFLGTNPGGSLGIPSEFMQYCLTLPATLVFIMALWTRRRLREGKPISPSLQLGFGLLVGGTLSNWSERVLHTGVTDFIYVNCFGSCIFNLADFFIDFGFMILSFEAIKVAMKERAQRAQVEVSN